MPRKALPVAAALSLCGLMGVVLAFPDNPPVAHTGGFGEPTCHACHFDNQLNDGNATFEVRGLAERFEAGRAYDLEIILVRKGMAAAGFQLSVRSGKGRDGGKLSSVDETTRSVERSVTYLQQTARGTAPAAPDTARWSFRWIAPEHADPVVFHAAGNAGNGDESQFGDFVYTLAREVVPH